MRWERATRGVGGGGGEGLGDGGGRDGGTGSEKEGALGGEAASHSGFQLLLGHRVTV